MTSELTYSKNNWYGNECGENTEDFSSYIANYSNEYEIICSCNGIIFKGGKL